MKFTGTPFKPVRRTWRQILRFGSRHNGLPCDGCNTACTFGVDYYMVHDNVWLREAGLPGSGCMLCIRCLTTRLGRALVRADFIDCPVNDRIRGQLADAKLRG